MAAMPRVAPEFAAFVTIAIVAVHAHDWCFNFGEGPGFVCPRCVAVTAPGPGRSVQSGTRSTP